MQNIFKTALFIKNRRNITAVTITNTSARLSVLHILFMSMTALHQREHKAYIIEDANIMQQKNEQAWPAHFLYNLKD